MKRWFERLRTDKIEGGRTRDRSVADASDRSKERLKLTQSDQRRHLEARKDAGTRTRERAPGSKSKMTWRWEGLTEVLRGSRTSMLVVVKFFVASVLSILSLNFLTITPAQASSNDWLGRTTFPSRNRAQLLCPSSNPSRKSQTE